MMSPETIDAFCRAELWLFEDTRYIRYSVSECNASLIAIMLLLHHTGITSRLYMFIQKEHMDKLKTRRVKS